MSKSKKQKSLKKQKGSTAKRKKADSTFELPSFLTNDTIFLIASFLLAAFYFSYSFTSNGFYQHDGAAHYLNMRNVWLDPMHKLAGRNPGFALFYALPAQFGITGVKVALSLTAGMTCFLVYRITKRYNTSIAFLAFILIATQHMWTNFSFRSHTEVASAFFLTLGVYFHQKEKYLFSALAFSFLGPIRAELYAMGFSYFLYLAIFKKKYLEALAMGILPLFFNITGWIATGKPLYLIDLLTGGPGKGTWTKAGFDHYFKFFSEVYGGTVVTLMVGFIGVCLLTKKLERKYWIVFIPATAYVLMQATFNLQAIPIGPYTGGTVRYLVVIAPLIAILGALGASLVEQVEPKWKILSFLLPLLIITGGYLSYEMVWMVTDIRKWDSTITIAITSLLIMAPLSVIRKELKYLLYGLIALLSAFISIKPYVIDNELATVKDVATWYSNQYGVDNGKQFYANHTMLYYFLERSSLEIEPKPLNIINDAQMQQAPKGAIILWDSHYGYRPNKANYELQYTYFTERPNEYKLIKQFAAPGNRFVTLVFEKL